MVRYCHKIDNTLKAILLLPQSFETWAHRGVRNRILLHINAVKFVFYEACYMAVCILQFAT